MADMDTVVDTETHGEHNVDAGDDVDGDVPEVEEPDDVGEADGDHECELTGMNTESKIRKYEAMW